MAFVHGKGTGVLIAQYDLSAFFSNVDASKTNDVGEVTTFGNDSKVYIAGQADGSLSLSGYFDGDAGAVDAALDGLILSGVPASVGIDGFGTIGNKAVLARSLVTDYTIGAPVGDAVSVSASIQPDGGVQMGGVVLANLAQTGSTGAYSSLDQAASTTLGAVAHLHVTDFDGTNCTIKVQDSTDNNVWADLISFSTVTAAGSERATVSGTVNRYVRVNITAGTFTDVTFAVTFARFRR